MDAMKSLIIYPLYLLKRCFIISIGWMILLIPLLINILLNGTTTITNNIKLYQFMSNFPYGKLCFSSLIPFFAPYSGSIDCYITELKYDKNDDKEVITCCGSVENYPWLRNPFQSIHAVALTNL